MGDKNGLLNKLKSLAGNSAATEEVPAGDGLLSKLKTVAESSDVPHGTANTDNPNLSDKSDTDPLSQYGKNVLGPDFIKPGKEASVSISAPDGKIVDAVVKNGKSVELMDHNKHVLDQNKQFILNDVAENKDALAPLLPGATAPAISDKESPLVNPIDNTDALTQYASARKNLLNQQMKDALQQLDAKYPQSERVLSYGSDVSVPVRKDQDLYETQKADIVNSFSQKARDITKATYNIASIKVVNGLLKEGKAADQLSPLEVGKKVTEATGDMDQLSRYSPAEQKLRLELSGYQAMEVAAHNARAQGMEAQAQALDSKTEGYWSEVRADNPEFVKEQVTKAISSEIYKSNNSIFRSIWTNSIDDNDIKDAAKKLGIQSNLIKNITPQDIKNPANIVRQAAGRFVGAITDPIEEYLMKLQSVHTDADVNGFFKSGWEELHPGVGKKIEGESLDNAGLFNSPTQVNTDNESENYLFNEPNPEAGKFNFDSRAILGQIAKGAGDIGSFISEIGTVGKAIKGIGLASDISKAERLSTFVTTAANTYNDAYHDALTNIGDKPEDESKRHLYAVLNSAIAGATMEILPPTELAHDILGDRTPAGRDFIQYIKDNGIAELKAPAIKDYVKNAVGEFAKDQGKMIGISELNTIGNNVTDMVLNPTSDRSVMDNTGQAAVTSGINMFLPSLLAGIAKPKHQSRMNKEMLFDIGSNPKSYIEDAQAQVEKGTMTQEDANKTIGLVGTMSKIVNNSVPEESVVNNEPLTREQKVDYANNLLQEALYTAKKENIGDDVQQKHIENFIKDLKKQREEILNNAGKEDIVSQSQPTKDEQVQRGQETNAQETNSKTGSEQGISDAEKNNAGMGPKDEGTLLKNEEVISSDRKNTADNPFNFEEDYPIVDNKTSENATKEITKQGAGVEGSSEEHQGTGGEGNPEAQPLPNSSNSNQRSEGRAQETQQQIADKFFNAPRKELEQTESEKVSPEIKDRFNNAEKIIGRQNTKVLNDGTSINGRYVLMDASAITPSHSSKTFSTTEGFPLLEDGRNPNDRDYTLKDNKALVINRANNYDGRAAEQVPTVDKNGIVIDGNDRTMSGQIAAKQNTDGKYIEALKQKADVYGFTPDQIDKMVSSGKHPRVIFVSDKVLPYNTSTFAAFNPRTTGKTKTPIEEAIQFGRTIDESVMNGIGKVMDSFDTLSDFFQNKNGSKLVKDMLVKNSILHPDNANAYFDPKKQKFTNAGKELLQNLMLGKVFSEDSLRLLEYSPSVREKMVYAMGNLISIEALGKEFSLKDHLSDALQLKDRVDEMIHENKIPADEKHKGLELYLSQGDLFGKEQYSEAAIAMWALMEDGKKTSMRQFSKEYLANAKSYTGNNTFDIFGNSNPTREEIINSYLKSKAEYEKYIIKDTSGKSIESTAEEANISQPAGANNKDVSGSVPESGPEPTGKPEENSGPVAAEKTEPASTPEPVSHDAIPEKRLESSVPDVKNEKLNAAIADFNKNKQFIGLKKEKIEKLEKEMREATGGRKIELETSIDREKALMKSYQNKKKLAELEINKHNASDTANKIRKFKIKSDSALTTPLQIPVALYNAAVEVAASSLEAGAHLRVAIQKAVDYVHDRHFSKWDEELFREHLGETRNVPFTADELRNKKASDLPISDKNKQAADALVASVKDDQNSLKTAIEHIDKLGISDTIKDKIKQYLRHRITEEIHKAEGNKWAVKHLKLSGGDFDEALHSMGNEYDTLMINATTVPQKENIRSAFAAGKAFIESRKTEDAVKNGTIQPIYHPEEPVTGPKFELPEFNMKKRIATDVQDKYSRLEEAQKHSIKPVTPETDAVTAMRLKKSKAWERINDIRQYLGNTEYVKGSLYDRMKKDNIDLSKFGLYLYAKHAEERNIYNADRRQRIFDGKVFELNQDIADAADNPSKQKRLSDQLNDILAQKDSRYTLMPDGGSGMTNKQAEEILGEVALDPNKDKYEAYAKEFRDNVVDKILDYKFESHLLSEGDYNQIRNYYKDYVPLKVDLDEETGGNGKNFANSGKNGRDLYRSKGNVERTFMERNNPMLQAAVDLESSIIKGENNKANIALANFSRLNPNEDVWKIQPANYEFVKDKSGKIVHAWENPDTRPTNNAIPFYENGKKSYLMLYDKGLQRMNKEVGGTMVTKVLSPVSRFIASYATLKNPEFFLKNIFFDQQDAYMSLLGNENPNIVKNFRSYIKDIHKVAGHVISGKPGEWKDWLDDWRKHGGEISYLSEATLEKHAKVSAKTFENYDKPLGKNQRQHLFSKFKEFASSLEQTTRVMAYRASVEGEAQQIAKSEGISIQEAMKKVNRDKAAVISRNATVDFEKKGVYGAYISAFKAFANAGIQGNANLVYLARKSKKVRYFLGAMFMSGMAEAELSRLFGDCNPPSSEDCYLGIPEFRKQKEFLVPLKMFGGHGYASIPIGRNFGWFNYAGKKMNEFIHGEIDPAEYMSSTVGSLLDYYNPAGGDGPIEQTIAGNAAPIVQLKTNKTNFETKIHPDNDNGLFESENYFPKTPHAYVEAASYLHKMSGGTTEKPGKIEISPNTLAFIPQSLFSGVYKFAEGAAETTSDLLKGESPKPNEIPIARTFYRTSNMSRIKKEYYDLVEKSKSQVLSEPEKKKLDDNLQMLVEGNEISDDQKSKREKYVKQNQSKVHQRISKRKEAAGEEETDIPEESDTENGGATGDY